MFGFRYNCPFCIGGFSDFYSAGFSFPVLKEMDVISAGYREHVRCPMCNSSNRERLMYLFLKSKGYLEKQSKYSVLHIAPEKSLQTMWKRLKNVKHLSIDLSSPIADQHMDISDLQLKDSTFDLVVCSNVLEHIIDDVGAMRELRRVLVSEGNALLMVPISTKLIHTYEDDSVIAPEDRERVFGQSDHVRIYALDFIDRAKKAGFDVHQVLPGEFLSEKDIEKYAIDPRESLFWCAVK